MIALLALLPLVCVVLAGGTTRWSQEIVLALVGIALALAPPRRSLGRGLNAVMLGLLALASTAFLPARWFGIPAWRADLTTNYQVLMPETLSAQPYLSAERFVLFALGLGWFYLVAGTAWTASERLRAGRIFAAGVAILSIVFVVLGKCGIVVPFWESVRNFGPFPNRNQTADFLAVGSLPALACARAAWRARRFPAAGGWLLAWMAAAAGVFNDYSKAGLGLLFAGAATYLGYETLRQSGGGGGLARQGRRLAVAASLVLLLACGFLVFGGETLQRVRAEVADTAARPISADFRLRIQRDALDLIAASPWCGVGLGNFGAVFADFRTRSAVSARALHPESDWLWMAGELGWPSLALALAGLVLLARRTWPPRRGPDRALRAAAAVGVALFAAHGFVDVSAHRLGTAMCALLLAGLAFGARGEGEGPEGGSARWVGPGFRLAGLAFIALACCGWQADRGQWDLPGSARAARLTTLARDRARARDFTAAEDAASRALAIAPLDWNLYFLRATARAYRHETADALADFRCALHLELFYGSLPFVEAQVWAGTEQPALAAQALLEACRREPDNAHGYISGFFDEGRKNPATRERLALAAENNPALEIELLSQYQPPQSVDAIAEAVRRNPELQGYDAAQEKRFLTIWAERGDTKAFVEAMDTNPDWQAASWREWAQAEQRLGRVQEACEILARHAPPPALPSERGEPENVTRAALEQAVAADAANPLFALRLFRARKADRDLPGALAALRAITARPDCPGYFFYLEAVTAGEAAQWPEAWEAWMRYPGAAREG